MPAPLIDKPVLAIGYASFEGGFDSFEKGDPDIEGSRWVHMATAGTWMAMFGLTTLTVQHFEEAKKNLDKNVPGVVHPKTGKPAVQTNYSHRSFEKAAAWIHKLDVRGKKLFALTTFTKAGKLAIEEEEFLAFSIEIARDFKDPITGKIMGAVLLGSALTNIPAVTKLDPVKLASQYEGYSIGDPDEPAPTQETKIMTLAELLAKFAGLSETDQSSFATKVMAMLSLASSEQEKAALSAAIAKVADFNKVTGELEAATKELSAAKADLETQKKENEFMGLLAAGDATPGQKDAFMKNDLKAFAAAGKEKPNTEAVGSGASQGEEEAKDAGEAFSKLNVVAEKIEKDKGLDFSTAMDEARDLHPKWAALADA